MLSDILNFQLPISEKNMSKITNYNKMPNLKGVKD